MKIVLLMELDRERLKRNPELMLRSCDRCGVPHMGYGSVLRRMTLHDRAVCAECEAEHITGKSRALYKDRV